LLERAGVGPGKVDTNDISISRHPKAVAAEGLAATSWLTQFASLHKIAASEVLLHVERVLFKLRKLAEFEFEDVTDS
jgi:hypothetical protein